jgi:hypothetical protein
VVCYFPISLLIRREAEVRLEEEMMASNIFLGTGKSAQEVLTDVSREIERFAAELHLMKASRIAAESSGSEERFVFLIKRNGVDPFLGETQTWKLSQRRFIKSDEIYGEDRPYLYILSIPYHYLFVKRHHFSLFSLFFIMNRAHIS